MDKVTFRTHCPKCGTALLQYADSVSLGGRLRRNLAVPLYCTHCHHGWQASGDEIEALRRSLHTSE